MSIARDDCFEPTDALMPLADALASLRARITPVVRTDKVALADALGRILAEPVAASFDVPPHDNSAVDGYAVYFNDLKPDGETRLLIRGRITAGHPLDGETEPGHAYRIFTGAAMPDGPDTVVMQEDVYLDADAVIIPAGVKQGANRRRQGEDVVTGKVVIEAGCRLRAQEIGVAASVGRTKLTVYNPLRAAVFSTGDEIMEPGETRRPGCIYDANRYTVMALLKGMGAMVTDLGILPDDPAVMRDALAGAAVNHHLIVTSGGVSVGDEDHVKDVVEALGSLHFWRLAIKPGRPIALGQVGEAAFVGLPGNPVAAMVTFMRIGRAVALLMAGSTDIDPPAYKVRAGFAMTKKPGRREWLRARIDHHADGPVAVSFRAQGSGILTSMVESDGLVELPEDCEGVAEGDLVDFVPFAETTR